MVKGINIQELKDTIGGGVSIWGAIGVGALVTFLVGVIDGFVRPLKCN